MQLHILKAGTESEIDAAFAPSSNCMPARSSSAAIAFFNSRREQLVALASRHAVPAIYEWREFAAAGGLISYGPSLTAAFRQVGIYAGRILKGAKPADLPVQQPTKFELVINLKTAKALGLTVPPSLLARPTRSSNEDITRSCSAAGFAAVAGAGCSGTRIDVGLQEIVALKQQR